MKQKKTKPRALTLTQGGIEILKRVAASKWDKGNHEQHECARERMPALDLAESRIKEPFQIIDLWNPLNAFKWRGVFVFRRGVA